MTAQSATRSERRGHAAWITLDSPENRNALSAPLVRELGDHLKAAIADTEVRAIVVTGSGPAAASDDGALLWTLLGAGLGALSLGAIGMAITRRRSG